ncbi:DUF1178 family protein [Limnohabitans parvus]|uniref:DUF1178 domain-containing protein n=1 Tax=Limnohabitans parvus II-B4 TaxID=1293052 RepID=A0A315E6F8_9BURK|nr:DUF1178 family protein [Limnohabitans parvus]PUE52699.1 hypothetical protein B9Z37_10995 [Limnohabitans parvus II-B4]
MKVLDLQCSQGHSFEGWFGSQDDYDAQRARGLLTCPVCNDSEIVKMLSAPRLNLGHGVGPVAAASETSGKDNASPSGPPALPDTAAAHGLQHMQAAMLNMVRHVIANTEDVGPQFAEEARKIHYGEREERNIRGQATREETEALLEEGIDVMPLPVPENLKGPLQ